MTQQLTTGNSVDDASQFTTGGFTPTASALVLAFVANVRPVLSFSTPAVPTMAGNGLTWQPVTTVMNPTGDRRLTCFRAMAAAPQRDAAVIDFADVVQDICAWSIFEFTGVDTSGSNGAGAVSLSTVATATATELTIGLGPASSARDHTVGAIMLDFEGGAGSVIAEVTEIHQQTPTQFLGKGLTLQTESSTAPVTKVSWLWQDVQGAASIALDVKAAPATSATPPTSTDPTIALIQRFEPILHLHPQESFVPVNAKRYVESAALWPAKPPFDDKNSWGSAPLIPAGQISLSSASDHYLGKPQFVQADQSHERFLELGGWKDAAETHETSVTAASANVYADRKEILRRYGTDLADSKFWYHAELFDSTRLAGLAQKVTAPALSKTLERFSNPALLCYYFFYPAHQQGVDSGTCANIEAKEVACHAGDWQCLAILLEDEGTGFTPKFFGITGSRPTPTVSGTTERYRPYAFDDEGRTVMKVEAWRTGSPEAPVAPDVVGDHPRLYVAQGSHSLYPTSGDHEVKPFEDATSPAGCGRFDTPSAVPPPAPDGRAAAARDSVDAVPLFILVKAILGGLLFNQFTVGFFAGIVEGMNYVSSFPFGGDTPGPTPLDPPKPDVGPATAGAGLTIRPHGLNVPGVGSPEPAWPNHAGLEDVIVDRTQPWWPSDDGASGFRGRWGQRVASDPLPHRAGVKFPTYWKMFLSALEQGFGDGSLTRP